MSKLPKIASLQNLFDISRKTQGWSWILYRWASKFYLNWCFHFWWAWPNMSKVLATTSMQYLCNLWIELWSRCLYSDKHESLLQVDNIFDEAGQACSKYPNKLAISLWHLKKEVRNKVRDVTALAGSSTTLAIYYTPNVLPPLNLSIWNQ